MIYPKIDDLLEKVPSKYALVIAAARRTRQINDYHGQLGEGSFESLLAARRIALENFDDGARGDRGRAAQGDVAHQGVAQEVDRRPRAAWA
jgi:DNA-directed RNA polymerase omega subunit